MERCEAHRSKTQTLRTYDQPSLIQHPLQGTPTDEGPFKRGEPRYYGSSYNILVEWGDHSESYEPLYKARIYDPLLLLRYAEENHLTNTPGWEEATDLTPIHRP